jgi:glyoxylase-like metal-dependent hydrolase (beta-lactamase superfamily II)
MIGSEGAAVIVDPQRDVEIYLKTAEEDGLTIKYVIETHLHADFVSGHRELAHYTGAKIYIGAKGNAKFEHVPVYDDDELWVGKVKLTFLETPGHTPESLCIVVTDTEQSNEPQAVLTGDTLFIGDVGRPDLLGASMSAADLAGMMYDSLHTKLLTLPDSVKVYPAHGAGSLCGRNMRQERVSTIGTERLLNYALQPMSREDFIQLVTKELPDAPQYFSKDAEINREGPELLENVLAQLMPLSAEAVENHQQEKYTLLDTRPADDFAAGHIPGAYNIALRGNYASWAGTLLPM